MTDRSPIWMAAAIHLVWAIAIAIHPEAAKVASISEAAAMFGPRGCVVVFLVAGVGAIVALKRALPAILMAVLLVPQQTLLIFSAYNAVACSIRGAYPDGYPKFGSFIFADQVWTVALCIAHFGSILKGVRWTFRSHS